ncbi:MAG: DinB family protein [Vicinamibacterales bacterium]
MTQRVLTWLTVVSLLIGAAPLRAGSLTDAERQRLLAHLDMTEAWLADEIAGLTSAQLAFRMRPGTWSIKDVVEHLAIAEPQYWDQLRAALAKPATGYAAETTDAAILWYGIDRTERATTGDARVPDGRFPSAQAAFDAFKTLRGTMRAFVRDTTEDLRGRQFGGTMDAYQWQLMISTHAQRHILQIREIKADPGYPGR